MFKYICLIGLLASGYGFPSQQQPKDAHSTTTILVPSTADTEAITQLRPIQHIKPAVEPNNQQTQNAAASIPFRMAGLATPPNQRRPIIVLHKPADVPKTLDDQETLDNAASEWWEHRWWQNDNNQFGRYNPYDSFGYNNGGYNNGWEQPQYNYYRTYWF